MRVVMVVRTLESTHEATCFSPRSHMEETELAAQAGAETQNLRPLLFLGGGVCLARVWLPTV